MELGLKIIGNQKRTEVRDDMIPFHAIECSPREKQTPENNRSLAPVQNRTITEAREA